VDWQAPAFPGSAPAPEGDEPRLENLGLPPLSEFPGASRDDSTARPTLQRPERQTEALDNANEPPKRRNRKSKAKAAEPGDEVEPMTWMDGLSSRLSAYSLADEEAAAAAAAAAAADGAPPPEQGDEADTGAADEQPSD
jgi:hypothetical protein